MIYGLRRMIYLLRKCDIISVPVYAKRISPTEGGYHTEDITRSRGNGYHCKKPLLSGRQKWFFTW